MAANTGAHPSFPSRPYTTNLARQQNQYNTGAYNTNTPFQTAQPLQPQNSLAPQSQQPRAPQQQDPVQYALEQINEEQREEINEAFALFDLDKDNHLDYHETKVAFKALGFELQKSELLGILQQHGQPASGGKVPTNPQNMVFTGPSRILISHAAFVGEAAIRIEARDPEEEINRAFELFDQDGKGRIDLEDLRRVARELGEGLQEEELRAMIEEFDVRGEGGINRKEFVGICLG